MSHHAFAMKPSPVKSSSGRAGRRGKDACRPIGPQRAMTLPIDTDHRRADALRYRAVELAKEARWEANTGRRRFLLDKARSALAAADEIAAGLPPEPQIFRNSKTC
jgi:hypothetical protein